MSDLRNIPTQDIFLELIRRAYQNDLPGEQIAADLVAEKNRGLWRAAFIWSGLLSSWPFATLLPLRNMDPEQTDLHADELCVISSGQDDERLWQLCKSWDPNEQDWIDPESATAMLGGGFSIPDGHGGYRSPVLRLWWD